MKPTILLGVAALAAIGGSGCASWRAEPVAVKTEVQSLPGIEVEPPRIYRDGQGFFAVGNLVGRGIGAHDTLAHLHYQIVNAQGKVTWEHTETAPSIRHNRFAARETTGYSFRVENPPEEGGKVKVVLHRGTAKKCKS